MEIKSKAAYLSLLIDGEWINPVSKNMYLFHTNPFNASRPVVNIIQKGSEDPILLEVSISNQQNKLQICVEGAEYEIYFSPSYEGDELKIIMPSGETIRLIKKTVKQESWQLSSL